MTDVRPARAADAAGIAAVHVAGWQVAYRGLLPDDFLDGLEPQSRRERWQAILAESPPDGAGTWVATDDGGVVGFASSGPARDDDLAAAGGWELYGIYVRPDLVGTGLGRRLLEACLSEAPSTDVTLWVLAGNVQAQGFYAHAGFVADGGTKHDVIGGRDVQELRLRRAAPA